MSGTEGLSGSAIAAAGLRVQQGRLRVMAENLANAQSTASTPGGDPYRRKIAVFAPVGIEPEPLAASCATPAPSG